MIQEVKKRTGWKTLDEFQITGGTRGRQCVAMSKGKEYAFQIRFNTHGEIADFQPQPQKA
jgi:hypothetical protein